MHGPIHPVKGMLHGQVKIRQQWSSPKIPTVQDRIRGKRVGMNSLWLSKSSLANRPGVSQKLENKTALGFNLDHKIDMFAPETADEQNPRSRGSTEASGRRRTKSQQSGPLSPELNQSLRKAGDGSERNSNGNPRSTDPISTKLPRGTDPNEAP